MNATGNQADDINIVTDDSAGAAAPSTVWAYLQLFRLPNVFTAMADVLLGFFFTHRPTMGVAIPWELPWGLLAILLGASALLYTSGMVLNDFFDAEVDRRERPQRPIPSGRVRRAAAGWLGFQMLLLGVGLAWMASYGVGDVRPGMIATALAAAVLLYDGALKKTLLGPLAMGSCRFFNVLLGMSVAAETWGVAHYMVAGGIGVYIVGVTLFARSEARQSSRGQLTAGTAIMAAGVALLWWFPDWIADSPVKLYHSRLSTWRMLLTVIGALIAYRCIWAIIDHGSPRKVQLAVANSIRSLIILDAFVCMAVAGMVPAITILALMIPMTYLGRRLYST